MYIRTYIDTYKYKYIHTYNIFIYNTYSINVHTLLIVRKDSEFSHDV